MTFLYDLLYALLLLLGWPLLLYRRLTRGPGSLAVRERLGDVPVRGVSSRCVWIHGVSLGEINATRTLVEELRHRSPETVVVISSTTRTGLERARQLYPKLTVFRFPLDFSFILRRVMERLRPSLIVLMELEAWPNLIEVARQCGVPVAIANGRVTADKSVRRFGYPGMRWIAQRMFGQIAWVGAQDRLYAERFAQIGVWPERIEVTGSLKYDAADVANWIAGQEDLAASMGIDRKRPLWVCGSTGAAADTGPSEEEIALRVYRELLAQFPQLQLAIVPRRPERFDEVAGLIVRNGFACLRRSTGAPWIPAHAQEEISATGGAGGTPAPGSVGFQPAKFSAAKSDGATKRRSDEGSEHAAQASASVETTYGAQPPPAADGAGVPPTPGSAGFQPAMQPPVPVFLGDTMGELRKFYALATVVFVGRTLVPLGGSDVMEAAGLGKPLLFGPHTENFAEPAELLLAENAARCVSDERELMNALADLLTHAPQRTQMGQAGQRAILSRRGATARTVQKIMDVWLGG